MKKILFLLCFIYSTAHTQRVQLSSIPGQDADMNINDMLSQIMAPYHQELSNIQNKRRDKEIELGLLRELRTNIDTFDRINRYIFGYESAFRSLTNENSDPTALALQVERIAKKGEYKIQIDQLAQSDSFSSPAVTLDKIIPPGMFYVKINDQSTPINFMGGNILNLANLLQQQLSNNIDVRIINTSDNTRTLSMNGKKTGENQKIIFDGDLKPLLDIELLSKGTREEKNITWPNNQTNLHISNNTYSLNLKEKIKSNSTLSFTINMKQITQNIVEKKENISLSNLNVSSVGSFNIEEIVIPGTTPILEDFTVSVSTNSNMPPIQSLILKFTDNLEEKVPLSNQSYLIDLKKYAEKCLTNIQITAEKAEVDISSFLISTTPEGALRPYHVISEAQDAVIKLDGVKITRSQNNITDLIPGVTFNLLESRSNTINVKIKPDIQLIKDTITEWVISYNSIMEEIFTLITIPIEKVGRLKRLHQREKDGEDLKEGALYGNTSLIGYRDRLRRVIGTAFGNDPNKISLLDQVGIYVRRANTVSTDPESVKKGTLTLDMGQFETVLTDNFDAVSDLFVKDTDGDRVGDIGVTVMIQEVDNMMIGNTGYLTRMDQESRRIMLDFNSRIAKKQDELDRVEQKERRALLQMNQAIAASKAQNESLKQRFGN
ncbi:MAG: flagellar filament capping protein FliD [Brevinema sp.]